MNKKSIAISLTGIVGVALLAAAYATNLNAGDVLTVNCPNAIRRTQTSAREWILVCTTATNTLTNTPSRTPTFTATALPTNTPTATATNTPEPTVTHVHTATIAPTGVIGLPPVPADILGTCTAEIHDRYVTTGPDGRVYRTWHPQAVLVDESDPAGPKCRFAHEHGDNPLDSGVFSTMPPFGYIAYVSGHPEEPHPGFKVAVGNKGEVNDEGRVMLIDSLVVFHMGTGSPNRYSQPHHSAIIAVRLAGGQVARVQGLFDTFGVGSICQRDIVNNDSNFSNDIGRTVMTLQGTGCEVTSAYEIWLGALDIRNTAGQRVYQAFVTMATFDPITTLDPANPTALIYTVDAFANRRNEAPFMGEFHGCDRENYHSAGNWYNNSSVTVYYTDAFGNTLPQGATGALRQEVARFSGETIGISQRADGTLNQFKQRDDYCAAGLGLKN